MFTSPRQNTLATMKSHGKPSSAPWILSLYQLHHMQRSSGYFSAQAYRAMCRQYEPDLIEVDPATFEQIKQARIAMKEPLERKWSHEQQPA